MSPSCQGSVWCLMSAVGEWESRRSDLDARPSKTWRSAGLGLFLMHQMMDSCPLQARGRMQHGHPGEERRRRTDHWHRRGVRRRHHRLISSEQVACQEGPRPGGGLPWRRVRCSAAPTAARVRELTTAADNGIASWCAALIISPAKPGSVSRLQGYKATATRRSIRTDHRSPSPGLPDWRLMATFMSAATSSDSSRVAALRPFQVDVGQVGDLQVVGFGICQTHGGHFGGRAPRKIRLLTSTATSTLTMSTTSAIQTLHGWKLPGNHLM